MKRTLYISLLMIVLVLPGVLSAQSKYAADFLNIPVGAKPLSMGGAFTAMANDESAFYWNPAGVSLLPNMTFGFMYSSEFGGLGSSLAQFYHAGFTLPMESTSIALNWVRLSVGDMRFGPDLTNINITQERQRLVREYYGGNATMFSDNEDALVLSVARNNKFEIDWGWFYFKQIIEVPIGINFKYISQKIGEYGSSSGIGIDAGMMVKFSLGQFLLIPEIGKLGIGLNVTDLLDTKLNWSTERQHEIPRKFIGGLAYTHEIPSINLVATMTTDLDFSDKRKVRMGFDAVYRDQVSFRAGLDRSLFTTGAGFEWQKKVKCDYSLLLHNDLGAVHRLSFGVNINKMFDLDSTEVVK
jgi:hypothetical protein